MVYEWDMSGLCMVQCTADKRSRDGEQTGPGQTDQEVNCSLLDLAWIHTTRSSKYEHTARDWQCASMCSYRNASRGTSLAHK